MTISQALVLTLLIALWATGNGVNLANNTTLVVILLIALISLSYATTTRQSRCQNAIVNAQNGGLFNTDLFA